MTPYLGEIASGLSSILWAFALILFRKTGDGVSPKALNLFKNCLGIPLLVATALALGVSLWPSDGPTMGLLAFSALFGMSIGDVLILSSLNRVGAGWMAVVNATYSPLMILITAMIFAIPLTPRVALGALLVAGAVALASEGSKAEGGPSRRDLLVGLGMGVLGQGLMAGCMAMLKYPVFPGTPSVLDSHEALFVATWRLIFGAFFLWIYLVMKAEMKAVKEELAPSPIYRFMVPGAFIGTYLAMIAWILGMKEIEGSLVRAAVLNQSNVILLPFLGAYFLKETLSARKLLAAAIAFTGATIIVMSR